MTDLFTPHRCFVITSPGATLTQHRASTCWTEEKNVLRDSFTFYTLFAVLPASNSFFNAGYYEVFFVPLSSFEQLRSCQDSMCSSRARGRGEVQEKAQNRTRWEVEMVAWCGVRSSNSHDIRPDMIICPPNVKQRCQSANKLPLKIFLHLYVYSLFI